jgi:hypothetical protein
MSKFNLDDLQDAINNSPMFMQDDNILDTGVIDTLEVVNIDIEAIGNEAEGKAKSLIEDLAKFYYDEEFLKSNPNFRRRVDNDMESLRMLLKMRAADEVTHDVLIKAIAANSGNASLYGSLTRVQATILQITTKIENIVNNLTNMIKGYQLELNFKYENEMNKEADGEIESIEDVSNAHRGSKSFIEQMKKLEEAQKEEEVE